MYGFIQLNTKNMFLMKCTIILKELNHHLVELVEVDELEFRG